MNPEIQEKVKLWRPTDDTGMLLNLSLTLRQATETGTAETRISRKVATFEAS